MKLELTPARTTDIERLVAIHALAFPDARGLPERRANFQDNPRGPLSDLFVARAESGTIVGHAFLFRMRTWIAGGEVPLSGLASVGVAPEARGQGVGRAIVEGLLDESKRRGDALQLLWPFSYRFYASLGFAAASPLVRLRVPCASLPRGPKTSLACTRANAADVPAIAAMYARAALSGAGLVTRSEALFARMLANPGSVAFVTRDHRGEVRGWVMLRFVEVRAIGSTELHVRELVAIDAAAECSLLGLVAAHRDQVGVAELTLPEGHPLSMLVSEPRAPGSPFVPEHLHALGQLAAGPMVRPIDVVKLLESRGYRDEGSLALVVRDRTETLGLRLEVDGHEPNTARVAAIDAAECGLEVDVATLGAIAVGALKPSDAFRFGLLRGDEGVAVRADRLFATGAPFRCLDEF